MARSGNFTPSPDPGPNRVQDRVRGRARVRGPANGVFRPIYLKRRREENGFVLPLVFPIGVY